MNIQSLHFTWLSNSPWTPSGYGQQTRIFTTRLAECGHQIGIICYVGLEYGVMSLGPNITCFPKRFHPYGNDIAVAHTIQNGYQFLISLMDTWVMNPEEYPMGFKWIPWFPVDHDPMPQIVRAKLSSAWRRIAMSKFGLAQAHNAGLQTWYIPHGVETKLLYPIDQAEARAALQIPNDRYVIGTVAMNKGNPSRKNFWEMMSAFALFHARHPDSFYLLQTDAGVGMNEMVNLPELGQQLGLVMGRDFDFCNQYQNALGFPPPYFQALYNALDVHLLVSAGEGFGIPVLEAQACGTPVIVGDWTASSELCLAGRKIDKKDAEPFYTSLASYQFKPHVGAILDALEEEYRHPTDTTAAVQQVQAEYDADHVVEHHWQPILAEIANSLAVPAAL